MKLFPSRRFPLSPRMLVHSLLILLLTSLAACDNVETDHFQGYVEGEYLQVASPIGGRLETLAVKRGITVKEGETLYDLERAFEAAALAEAEQGVARAQNRLADLSKGSRPTELAALEAKLDQAKSSLERARAEFERRRKLFQEKAASQEALDRSRSEMAQGEALVAQLQAELETAKLGGRPDAIAVARSEAEAARQKLKQAQWALDQKHLKAPQGGLVADTFFVPGEFVPAGYPVVAILPPAEVRIRFFVPEPVLATLQNGMGVTVSADGIAQPIRATISFLSPRAEYTPPVIYSRETRDQLVYMIEASPEPQDASNLHPGQPVDVRLETPDA